MTLPYNEKLGYVQCQLFYAHLITHFNKHENDILQPSKCKHCQKCILHVRYMKEHLTTDHSNSSSTNFDSPSTNSSPNKIGNKPPKKQADNNIQNLTKSTENLGSRLKKADSPMTKGTPGLNLRKRRRSARIDDDLTGDTNSTNSKSSGVNSPANLYDFEDQIDEKFEIKEELTESSTNETNDPSRVKAVRKYTKGRKSSTVNNTTKGLLKCYHKN